MNPRVYDFSMLAGLALVGVGVGMVNVPAALVAVGALVLALTVYGAHLATRKS